MAMDSAVRDDPTISPLLEQHQGLFMFFESGKVHLLLWLDRITARGWVGGNDLRRDPSDRSCSPFVFVLFIGFKMP
jgi:hypothetical protein